MESRLVNLVARLGLGMVFALAFAPLAVADEAAAEAAFVRGEYDTARTELSDSKTADALAFRARALLAEAMSGPADPPEDVLHRALDDANVALIMDPAHAEGRLQRAIALSLILRPMSTREARKTGWAEEARDLARGVLEDEPGNVYAHGFLSVWNLEVVNRGGRIGAMIMGAGVSDGRDHYEAAIAAAPDEASVHWQWARALAALIAFGRGHWLGLGLGKSVQKLFYLPEAHTDFVFALLAEEWGLIGTLAMIVGFAVLGWRLFVIGRGLEQRGGCGGQVRAHLGAELAYDVHDAADRAVTALGRARGEVGLQVGVEVVVDVAGRGRRLARDAGDTVGPVRALVTGPLGEGAEELGGLLGHRPDVRVLLVLGVLGVLGPRRLLAHRAASWRRRDWGGWCGCWSSTSTKRTRSSPSTTRAPATRSRESPEGSVSRRR